MSDLSLFFANSTAAYTEESVIVSSRFKDSEGNLVPWRIKTITEEENEEIRKYATRYTKGKHGTKVPEHNQEAYVGKLISESVVYPDLKNAELQKSYGVIGAEKLVKKMLFAGEYAKLVEKIQAINGFDVDVNEIVDDIKN